MGEICKNCRRPVAMICQQGTGYCSANCEDAHKEHTR